MMGCPPQGVHYLGPLVELVSPTQGYHCGVPIFPVVVNKHSLG